MKEKRIVGRRGVGGDRWGVYVLRCADETLYCGVTTDMEARLIAHNAGRGAKYTRGRLPVQVAAFSGACFSHGDVLRMERRIKRLPRTQKIDAVKAMAALLSARKGPAPE